MNKRVVITGMGAITPIGNDLEEFWNSIKEEKVGIDNIKSFDTEDYKVKLAAEVKDFNPEEYMDKKEARRLDRFCQFAVAAAQQAVDNSKLDLDEINKRKIWSYSRVRYWWISNYRKGRTKIIRKGSQ